MLHRLRKILIITTCLFSADLQAQTAKITIRKEFAAIQDDNNIRELQIGDQIPNLLFENIANHTTKKAKLSDFKSQLIILDFWSSACAKCIELFPDMDALQKDFGDQIKIILVDTKSWSFNDDLPKITAILNNVKNRTGKTIDLPSIYNCSTLDSLFPCRILPNDVWIDSNGRVAAITSYEKVTKQNIQAFLNHAPLQLQTKKDVIAIDYTKPRFIQENIDSCLYQSILTNYVEGINGSGVRRSKNDLITGLYYYNFPVTSLYESAYSELLKFPRNRWVLDISSPVSLNDFTETKQEKKRKFCYELSVPPSTFKDVSQYMQQDLIRSFHITIKNEKRMYNCYILKATDDIQRSYANGNSEEIDIGKNTANKYARNTSTTSLTALLNSFLPKPLIDETNLPHLVNIDLPYNLSDTRTLLTALQKAGFEIKEEQRELEISVISDK